jgi:cellulose synthase operon protein C
MSLGWDGDALNHQTGTLQCLDIMQIPVEILCLVQALYDRGLHLQAYQTAIAHAPLAEWEGTQARILAGRIALQVGGQRRGYAYHLQAWRGDRSSPTAAYYGRFLMARQGLLAAWEFARAIADWPQAPDRERAEWWSFQARLLSEFRDFDAAIALMKRAIAIDPKNYWLYVTQAWIWEERDLYPEAKAAAQIALQLKPYDSAATLTIARMLTLLEREDDALALLQETLAKTESSAIAHTLAQLQTELGDYVAAQQHYQRYGELTPLLEPAGQQWLLARQTDLAYYLGDIETASQLATQVESYSYQKIVERLQIQPLVGKRVLLPVGFVRQHQMTCAPATLATLTRFWGQPADHLTIAAEICYDGTAPYRERLWAEQNGWIAREFTITWASAIALIDRGIPFTLGTVEPTSAHLQAVIGYDSNLHQLLIRDPYDRQIGEMWAQEMLAHYAAFGPRGMLILPQDKSELLADLELPDADLYDRFYELQGALEHHRRETANQIYQQLVAIAPTHRLTLDAERAIAVYDGDQTRVLAAIEQSLVQFPDCGNLILGKLSCLRELARREERLEILANMCAIDAHPVFVQYYAQAIGEDGRSAPLAIALLKRTIRQMPSSAQNYYSLAQILWLQREYDLAFDLYRFATCLEDKQSHYAKTYFFTARHRNQIQPAIELLEQRWHRLGTKSAEPLLTLCWAYSQLNRTSEAFELLDSAIAASTDREPSQQSELLMGAADAYAEYGRYHQAQSLLDRARDTVAPSMWLRTAAELAARQGDTATSYQHWQAILAIEPLAIDVNRSIANYLAETQSVAAALDFLKTACERFPHSYSLHQLWSGWAIEIADFARAEQILRHLVEIDPSDAWTRRQLARVLGNQRKLTAAMSEIEIARQLNPHSPTERILAGYLQELAGDIPAAKIAYKESIKLSIDSEGAIGALLAVCYTHEERQAALAFIFTELTQQVTMGDAIDTYQAQAANILDPATLLAQMQEAWTHRPDLWQAWSALISQLLQFDRVDEALALALKFTERYPLLPKAWLDLSSVYRQQGDNDNDNETIALHRTLEISPTWNIPIGRLSRVYERTEQFALGKELLENAICRDPRDLSHHCHLAELLWQTEERTAALARLKIVVQTTSGGHHYAWAWEKLKAWSIACECPEFATQLVRELTHTHSGDARSWYFLADTLSDEDRPECLAALDRAIDLDPYYIDAYDLQARLLVRDDAHEAALAVCNTTAWGTDRPTSLRARAVWVEQQWGKHQDAIDRLQEIVTIEPDFEWAWLQLAQYFDRSDDLVGYFRAAQRLVAIDPHDPVNWGYLGDAYNRTGDPANARSAWEKSLEVSPSYEYGGLSLFDLHWQAADFYAAAATFAKIQPQLAPASYLPLQIRLAIHYQDKPAAESALAELCHCELEHSNGLRAAIAAMKSAGLTDKVESILHQQLSRDTVSPRVQFVWMENAAELNLWQKIDRFIKSVDFRTELGQQIVQSYLQILSKHQQKKLIYTFISKYDLVLRSEISLWGSVGLALRVIKANRQLISWYWDWQQRSTAAPWMLGNLNEALRGTGADVKARYVNRAALKLPIHSGIQYHFAWMAFDLAAAGNLDAVNEYLRSVLAIDREPEYQFLVIVQAIVTARSTMGTRTIKLKIIARHLAAAKAAYPEFDRDKTFYRAYFQALEPIFVHTFHLQFLREWLQATWYFARRFLLF